MHLCIGSSSLALGSKSHLLCLLLCSDPQLFHFLGLEGSSPLLHKSGLDSCIGLFPELLSLCEHVVILRFLGILTFLISFNLCNCGDPS